MINKIEICPKKFTSQLSISQNSTNIRISSKKYFLEISFQIWNFFTIKLLKTIIPSKKNISAFNSIDFLQISTDLNLNMIFITINKKLFIFESNSEAIFLENKSEKYTFWLKEIKTAIDSLPLMMFLNDHVALLNFENKDNILTLNPLMIYSKKIEKNIIVGFENFLFRDFYLKLKSKLTSIIVLQEKVSNGIFYLRFSDEKSDGEEKKNMFKLFMDIKAFDKQNKNEKMKIKKQFMFDFEVNFYENETN